MVPDFLLKQGRMPISIKLLIGSDAEQFVVVRECEINAAEALMQNGAKEKTFLSRWIDLRHSREVRQRLLVIPAFH